MPSRRVTRYRGRAGAVAGLARGAGYAWRNRKTIVKAGRRIGKSIRKYFAPKDTVTEHRDVRTSGPPKPKHRNKRFTKRVEGVISEHAGRNTVIFNGSGQTLTTTAGFQEYTFLTLFGNNGGAGQSSDLAKISTFYEDANDIENPESKNFFFNYGVQNYGFTNTSTTSKMILEIHEYKVRTGANQFASPSAMYNSAVADEEVLTDPSATAGKIELWQLNASPYQIPDLCKFLKFGKKTTIALNPLGYASYTLARKKNKWISGKRIRDSDSFAYPGWTEGILVIIRGAPNAAGSSAASVTVAWSQTRKYSWRAMDPDAKNEYLHLAY